MTLRTIALLGAASVAAATAPQFDINKERVELRAAASRSFDAAQRAMNFPLEAAKAAVAASWVDSAAAEAAGARDWAARINSAVKDALTGMEAAVKGRGKRSFEQVIADLIAPIEELNRRRENLQRLIQEAKFDKDAEDVKKLLFKALGEIDDSIKRHQEAIEALKDLARRAVEIYKKAAAAAQECERAGEHAAGAQRQLAEQAAAAKAKISELGQEPQNETRTRAGMAIEPLGRHAKNLFSWSDSLLNRSEDFRHAKEKFDVVLKDFEAGRRSAAQWPERISLQLDQAEKAFAQSKRKKKD